MAFGSWTPIKLLWLFVSMFISITYASKCTAFDQAQVLIVANNFFGCLGIDQAQLTEMINELLSLQDLDLGQLVTDLQACAAIECPDGGFTCFAKVDCANEVISELDLLDISVGLPDALEDVVLNYCECYDKLEDIDTDCYDYIDGLVGFHVPIAEMIQYGDQYCGSFTDVCGLVETFLDDCVAVEPAGIPALCDEYVSVLLDSDSSLQACASQVMAVSLLPPFAMDLVYGECGSLSDEDKALLEALTDSSQCNFDIADFSPTITPTIAPTAIDAVSIDMQFSISTSASVSSSFTASVKTALATQLSISESDIRNLDITAATNTAATATASVISEPAQRRRLLSVYTVSCILTPSLSATGATSESTLAATYSSQVSSSSFEAELSTELGTSVTVSDTNVVASTPSPISSPTKAPSHRSPSSSSNGSDTLVVGASLSVSLVCVVLFIGFGWYFMKKNGLKFLAMTDDEEGDTRSAHGDLTDEQDEERNSVEMRSASVQDQPSIKLSKMKGGGLSDVYNKISNPVNEDEAAAHHDNSSMDEEDVPLPTSFVAGAESAWL